jgi:hypothetical protein
MSMSIRRMSPCLRLVCAGVFACWMVTAASGAVPVTADAQQAPEGFPAEGQPAIVTLLSPGQEPRKALRYRIARDHAARMEMSMLMGMAMEVAGTSMPAMQLPAITVSADVAATEVSPSGDVSVRTTFTGSSVEATAGVDPAIVAAMQGMNADLKGLASTSTISDRGIVRSIQFDLSSITNQELRNTMGSLSSSIEQLSMALPEEPVGVGARWEVRQRLVSSGTLMFQRMTIEVKAIDGDVVTLGSTMEQHAPPQAVSNPALPPDAEIWLQGLSMSGQGEMTLDLRSLVPTSSMSGTTDTDMEVRMAGAAQAMTMHVTMKLSVAPGK